ncbi:MAG: TolC family protein [Candidatus Tectomicrobia bacterium]|uniref:TolC family protein n=1 Tax=Tectimicrobiota bacterium TaxID=2528274 RepID=A0A932GQL0_UNCTE|nr:TolC family protein [Candidatus Tectomicrobia bacterium]
MNGLPKSAGKFAGGAGLITGGLLLLFLAVCPSYGQEVQVPALPKVVSIEKAVEIALQQHPNLRASLFTVEANQARVGQALSGFFPQLGVSGQYTRSGTELPFDRRSQGSTTAGSSNSYGLNLNLNQTLIDFGRTSERTDVARDNLRASQEDLNSVRDQIIFNVRQSYYQLLASKRLVAVNEETVAQFEKRLEEARSFYEVGVRPRFDVTSAEVNLSNARLNLIRVRNNLELARVTLNNAMGIPNDTSYDLVDNLGFSPVAYQLPDILLQAEQNRPELKSLKAKRQSAEDSLKLSRTNFFPTLTGNAGYGVSGKEFPLNRTWNFGAVLSFDLFSGFETREQVAEARANVENVKSQEENLRLGIRREVQQAFLNLQEAQERVRVGELVVRQAQENLELARGRYQAGVGTLLEETDARVSLTNAQTTYVQALYDFRTAQASLEKAAGVAPAP